MSHTATCDQVEEHHHWRLPPAPAVVNEPARGGERLRSWLEVREVRWSALAAVLFLLGLLARTAGAPSGLSDMMFAGCYLSGGWEPTVAGLRALRKKSLDVDLLMIVAALVAAGSGQVLDGALLIVIFATSGALEAVATKRTRDSIRSLLDLAPEQAARLDAEGTETVVDVADLTVGDVVVVRPGERIGADGRVVVGESEVDQASITGEPLPVAKAVSDEVFAGTLNGAGVLRVRVERPATDSVVARIVTLVEEASATKAKAQLFIERVERRYSVAVVAATVALFVIPLAAGAPLQTTLLRAMTFMIVASPCAVVLATMPPLLSAIANAGRHGVLVKTAVVMEQLGLTDLVAFDKTGTLTQGTPRLDHIRTTPATDLEADELLRLAAAAEMGSEHPIGRAVVAAAQERGWRLPEATAFVSLPGRGIQATVHGHRMGVGSPRILPAAEAAVAGQLLDTAGRTAVVVTIDGALAGVLTLVDEARAGASDTTAALARLTGRRPVLLTGDSQAAASMLAAQVGISDIRAGLLPDDKVAAVQQLQSDGTALAVVGDGVNDAPALAAAHLGLAMGREGADLTLETADAVIVRDELSTIPSVIDLSRRAKRVITQNLCFATAVIITLVAIDLTGHLPLPLGVAGHEGSTIIVGLNGLRLLHRRSWTTRPAAHRTPDDGRRDGDGG